MSGARSSARATGDGDWAVQTADTIERVVGSVRSNTSDRLVSVARLVVLGLLAGIMGSAALVLTAIGLVRLLDVYLPSGVWVAALIIGGIFTFGGLFLWRGAWQQPRREARCSIEGAPAHYVADLAVLRYVTATGPCPAGVP